MQVAKLGPALSLSSSKRSRTEPSASLGDDTSASSPSASTGIPTLQLDELLVRDGEKLPLLRGIMLLDTCVIVIDAAMFFYDDPRMLADVEENRSQLPDTYRSADRPIEFSDIFLFNKTDLVPAKDVETI
ncbi:hypothetical protein PRNP1_002747 [Phytophthora ramorum]